MKTKISFLIILCLILNVSCSDSFLEDKKDYSVLSSTDIYSDPDQANAVFAEIYMKMMSKGGYSAAIFGADPLMRHNNANGGRNSFFTEELPVTAPTGSNLSATGLAHASYQNNTGKTTYAGNHVSGTFYWNGGSGSSFNNWDQPTLYPATYNINQYIDEIKNVGRPNYPQEEGFWDHLEGQSLFARAWLYMDAVRLWGGLPYYTTDEDMPANDDRSERLAIDECFDKICEDFQKAAELLPATWGADNYGRFTSVGALAMISRARLYQASPVFNAGWDNTSSKRWKAALEASLAAEAAANAAGYTGVSSIDEWDKSFYIKGAETKEGIIIIPKSSNTQLSATYANKWESIIRPASVAENSCPGIPVSKQMIDLFPLSDGSRATDKNGNPINGYDPELFFLNRDPRFYRTFAFSGCEWPGTNKQIWLYAYQNAGSDEGTFSYTDGTTGANAAKQKSKAIVWKMSDPSVSVGTLEFSGATIMEYRYAELLLNIAECYAATGDLGQCTNYINKVRNRVGAPNIPVLTSKYNAIEACLYERRIELAYEGKRPWDARRWLLYEGGAGFDPSNAANTRYTLEEAWGQGWRIYDGADGRESYSINNNILTRLDLMPISGTKHMSEIWAYNLTVPQEGDPISNETKSAVPSIKRDDESGREAALQKLAEFYKNNLNTVNPATAPMDVSYGMDSNNATSAQAENFLFTWRGWFNVWPIHYNQRIQEATNDWITQNVGWNIGNTSTKDQDGTYVYCTTEE